MTIKQIYDFAIKEGIKNDIRGDGRVKEILKRENDKFNKLSEGKKADFDEESLVNPYSDSRVYHGDLDKKIKKVLIGIDIDTAEVLLASEINRRHPDNPIDLIISHHPISYGLAGLHEVMELQAEVYAKYGVPINIAEKLMKKRIGEVSRSVSGANHCQSSDAAKLLDIPIMSIHTPADNHVANFLVSEIKKREKKLVYVQDIMDFLLEIPEYKQAVKRKAGPMIFAGSPDSFAGKIAVTEITGGTDGAKELYERLAHAGVGTVLSMHLREEWKEEAAKNHLNVVMVGHISSDSLGLNLLFDKIEKRGVEIVACSGFDRFCRNKKPKSK